MPKAQKHHVEAAMKQATSSAKSRFLQGQFPQMYTPDSSDFNLTAGFASMDLGGMSNGGAGFMSPPPMGRTYPQVITDIIEPQRCVYIGNVPVDTTVEELCNIIRGGNLQQIRFLPVKNCAVSPPSDLRCLPVLGEHHD